MNKKTETVTTPECLPAATSRPDVAPAWREFAGVPQVVFVGSDVYRQAGFGSNHPLSIPRVATVMDLCADLGWLNGEAFQQSPMATSQQLAEYHDPDYIAALRSADSRGRVDREVRQRFRIGTMENPLFPGLFQRAATSVAGSVLAAELALAGKTAFHPSGGTHHGRPDHASGFCYFNDPVFALLTLLKHGLQRVLYVDLDAHHGDAVQDAFAADSRVFTISVHETGRWPFTGPVDDRAHGQARNLPVPKGFNDTELNYVMTEAVIPLARRFESQALVVTCGADGLHDDPLAGMSLSNRALWTAVENLVSLTDHSVVLGGGGYNPWSVARCWTGLWACLAGFEIPAVMPQQAQDRLRQLECDLIDDDADICAEWMTTLEDRPRPGPVRDEVRRVVSAVLRP